MIQNAQQFAYLRPEDVLRLKSYEFAPKMVVEGYLAGQHRSARKGQSVEFFDYRQYARGDDIRTIDWRVFARTDRHYVRLFEQQTDMDCYIVLDASNSMAYGEPHSKLEYCSFFTACLAYLVSRQGDRVSLSIVDDTLREHVPPGGTHRHLTNILNLLERNTPGGETNLSEGLLRATPLFRKRGILIVVSDLLDDPSRFFLTLNPYLHRGFRVMLFHVMHPDELALPRHGYVRYRDMETGRHVLADTDELGPRYAEAVAATRRNLRTLATRKRVEYIFADTSTPYFNLFDEFTTRRGAGSSRGAHRAGRPATLGSAAPARG